MAFSGDDEDALRQQFQLSSPNIAEARFAPVSMICDLIVLLAVRADLIAAHSGSNLLAPVIVASGFFSMRQQIGNPGFEHRSRHPPILVLASCGSLCLDARWNMPHHNAGLGLVAVLTAGTGVTGCERQDIDVSQHPFTFFDNWKGCNGNSRRVNTSLAFRWRNTLPTMPARFREQPRHNVGSAVDHEVKDVPDPRWTRWHCGARRNVSRWPLAHERAGGRRRHLHRGEFRAALSWWPPWLCWLVNAPAGTGAT